MVKVHRKTYGRKKGRPLGKARTEVLETSLALFSVPEESLTEEQNLPPSTLFSPSRHPELSPSCHPERSEGSPVLTSFWLEIGFGAGEHLSALCRRNPQTGYIGAEPFINGVAALLKDVQADEMPIENLRILHGDAMKLALSFTPASLDGIYVLNPDPWPKKRHHNRRIIRPDTLDVFARILKSGGALIMSTDVDDLAEWMVTHASNHPAFTWTARTKADWQIMPEGWIPTRYEQKGITAGRKQTYLIFTRK